MQTVSFWERESWLADADVAIIGGGLLGLWTAIEMRRADSGLRVVVAERSAIPLGASTRNAGFACFGSPSEMWYDAGLNGTDPMLELVEMRFKGIAKIKRQLGAEAIGFEACGGFECYSDSEHGYAEKLAALNQLLAPIMGTAKAFEVADEKLTAFGLSGFSAMVENSLEGSVHSGRLVSSLIALAKEEGVQLLFGTEILHVDALNTGCLIQTTRGALRATKVVYTTNAFLSQLSAVNDIVPARGQVLVTHPIKNLALRGTFHFDEGFYYWRNLGDRILLGGARNSDFEGERTLDMGTSQVVQQALENFLVKHMGQYFNGANVEEVIDLRWSGLMAMSQSKQPVLRQVSPGVWVAMCCNGMGVALSPVFSEQVARQVLTS